MKRVCVFACMALMMAASPALAKGKQKKVTANEEFVMLKPLTASVGGPYRFSAVMNLEIGLDIPDEKLRKKVKLLGPVLRDAHSRALTKYAMTYYRLGTVPDIDTLARNLQRATNQALDDDGARVLMGSVIVHN